MNTKLEQQKVQVSFKFSKEKKHISDFLIRQNFFLYSFYFYIHLFQKLNTLPSWTLSELDHDDIFILFYFNFLKGFLFFTFFAPFHFFVQNMLFIDKRICPPEKMHMTCLEEYT